MGLGVGAVEILGREERRRSNLDAQVRRQSSTFSSRSWPATWPMRMSGEPQLLGEAPVAVHDADVVRHGGLANPRQGAAGGYGRRGRRRAHAVRELAIRRAGPRGCTVLQQFLGQVVDGGARFAFDVLDVKGGSAWAGQGHCVAVRHTGWALRGS